MDWYAWLCRAGLGPDLASEYALLFSRNELGAADVRHFDHAFLAAMGVAVAKHRLEILKLARKESSSSSVAAITVLPWRATRLLAAAAHRSLAGCLRSVARRDRAAVAPRPRLALCHQRGSAGAAAAGARWTSASTVARRGRTKLAFLTHVSKPMLMLTNSSGERKSGTRTLTTRRATAAVTAAAGCFGSTETFSDYDADEDDEENMDGDEEMPWESMFEDLNPT